jgi:hypothetical protein
MGCASGGPRKQQGRIAGGSLYACRRHPSRVEAAGSAGYIGIGIAHQDLVAARDKIGFREMRQGDPGDRVRQLLVGGDPQQGSSDAALEGTSQRSFDSTMALFP